MKIYLDTSVYGMAGHKKPNKEILAKLLDKINNNSTTIYYSDVVGIELDDAPKWLRDEFDEIFERLNNVKKLHVTDDSLDLAEYYLDDKILPEGSDNDALHIALATLSDADFILSNNMRHFVRNNNIISEVNKMLYLPQPHIITPETFLLLSSSWKKE